MFGAPLSLTIEDPAHSQDEVRFVTVGESVGREIVVIVYTERENSVRIISARKATRHQRGTYESGR